MSIVSDIAITAAVEGLLDEAVVRRLIRYTGGFPGPIHGKRGKSNLKENISGYNNSARYRPWIVLVDLHTEADCVPPILGDWLENPALFLCFRVVVRAIEIWLLADRENISRFLGISQRRIPPDLEVIEDPKQFMVNLARHSRSSAIRQDMVPRPGSGVPIGPNYTTCLIEFVTSAENRWRPEVAIHRSDSLSRAVRCLRHIIQLWRNHGHSRADMTSS